MLGFAGSERVQFVEMSKATKFNIILDPRESLMVSIWWIDFLIYIFNVFRKGI